MYSSWTPFVRTEMRPPTSSDVDRIRAITEERQLDFEAMVAPRLNNPRGEMFVNNVFQVVKRREGPLWHLSVKPLIEQRVTWPELQRVKNELVGCSNEGVQLFPSEDRLIDTADQYHLWVAVDAGYRFPFGFDSGRLVL